MSVLSIQASRASPYKGLANYTEQDAMFFFGRERERDVIIANVKARRLTLLYGESGVGKSSLLRAGVASHLAQTAREEIEDLGSAEYFPVVFSAWRDQPVAGLSEAIRQAAEDLTGEPLQLPSSGRLQDVVASAAHATGAYLLIILDQFEEYFLYHAQERGKDSFAAQLPRAINHEGLQAGFLLSIREDGLAKLDRFKRELPKLFDTYLRVEHLDASTAREVIRRPLERYNELAGDGRQVTIESALVEAVVSQIRTGQVVHDHAGQGGLHDASAGPDRIETPYLQLVMTRLWETERATDSETLHLQTLTALGGASEIVRTHLDISLSDRSAAERDAIAEVFHHLVTPSGSKIAHAARDLAEYTGRATEEIEALLERLSSGTTRIVRPAQAPLGDSGPARYEIFHDVLAPAILNWRPDTPKSAAGRSGRA